MEELVKLKGRLNEAEFMDSANQLMEDIITFNRPWDMERCLTPYPVTGKWDETPNGDEEWCFMLNRFDYANSLIFASIKTADVRYAKKWKNLVFDWLKQHEIIQKAPSTRTLDTAIRCLNFTYGRAYLEALGFLTEVESEEIKQSILKQFGYLRREYIEKYTLSNWGSIQTTAILICLWMLDEAENQRELFQWAVSEVEVQYALQILEDGNCWEQSTMYHVEVMKMGFLLYFHSEKKQFHLSNAFKETLYKMARALFMQRTPKGEIEAFGDSDRVAIDDVLSIAATLFHDGELKFSTHLSADELYNYGCDFADVFDALLPIESTEKLYFGRDSGLITLRSDFSNKANFLMISNGALGSGHGHSDNLHFSLYYQGQPFLIDNGRYTYREDCELRPYLKSMVAHNCVIIDDDPISKPKGSWDYERFCTPLKNYYVQKADVVYFECAIAGVSKSQDYVHLRKFFVLQDKIWIIFDEIKMQGEHQAKSYFHFDPAVELVSCDNQGYILKNGEELKMSFDEEQTVFIENNQCSLNYNELLVQKVIQTNKIFHNQLVNYVMILGNNAMIELLDAPLRQAQSESLVSKEIATAKEIRLSETESYLLVVFHQETIFGKKLYYVKDIPIYGKSIVIHILDRKVTISNLRV